MSVHISSIVWKTKLHNAGLKMVLLALADIANHEGECWPSVGTLGEMTCLGQTAVKGHIQALKESGILSIEPRHTGTGRQTSNFFRIHTEALKCWGESESDPSQKVTGEGPESDGGRGSKSDPPRGQNPAPLIRTKEPPPEPPKEPTPKPPEASTGSPPRGGDFFADQPTDTLPPDYLRIGALLHRRATTAWSPREIKALQALKITPDDLELVEKYYLSKDIPAAKDYRRRDLLTLLNNWPGEVDRARAHSLTLTPTNAPAKRFTSQIGK